jgi:hypothetical protein
MIHCYTETELKCQLSECSNTYFSAVTHLHVSISSLCRSICGPAAHTECVKTTKTGPKQETGKDVVERSHTFASDDTFALISAKRD